MSEGENRPARPAQAERMVRLAHAVTVWAEFAESVREAMETALETMDRAQKMRDQKLNEYGDR